MDGNPVDDPIEEVPADEAEAVAAKPTTYEDLIADGLTDEEARFRLSVINGKYPPASFDERLPTSYDESTEK